MHYRVAAVTPQRRWVWVRAGWHPPPPPLPPVGIAHSSLLSMSGDA